MIPVSSPPCSRDNVPFQSEYYLTSENSEARLPTRVRPWPAANSPPSRRHIETPLGKTRSGPRCWPHSHPLHALQSRCPGVYSPYPCLTGPAGKPPGINARCRTTIRPFRSFLSSGPAFLLLRPAKIRGWKYAARRFFPAHWREPQAHIHLKATNLQLHPARPASYLLLKAMISRWEAWPIIPLVDFPRAVFPLVSSQMSESSCACLYLFPAGLAPLPYVPQSAASRT